MEAGENVSVLARELGVSRKSIYQWRNRYRLGGGNALRGRGRMTKAQCSGS
jgi:transposase-like protein